MHGRAREAAEVQQSLGSSGCMSFQSEPVTFSEEAFLAQKPGSPLQAFHQRAVHLQLFKQVRQRPEGRAGASGAQVESV